MGVKSKVDVEKIQALGPEEWGEVRLAVVIQIQALTHEMDRPRDRIKERVNGTEEAEDTLTGVIAGRLKKLRTAMEAFPLPVSKEIFTGRWE